MSATSAQVKAIHALKTAAGMDEASYRAALQGFGVRSSKELTGLQANGFIESLKSMQPAGKRPASTMASGRYAPKLQALWIAGHDLGVVRSRDDKALIAFVQRQTNATHTRFLTDPKDATKAIEALKSWLARGAGVIWPEDRDPKALIVAILEAQWRRLVSLGAIELERPQDDPMDGLVFYVAKVARGGSRRFSSFADATVTADELREGQRALGRKLRQALSNKKD